MTKHMSNKYFLAAVFGVVSVAVLVLALAPGTSGDEPLVDEAEAEVVDEAVDEADVVGSAQAAGKGSKPSATPTTDDPADPGDPADSGDPADPGDPGNGGGNGKPQINPEVVQKWPGPDNEPNDGPTFDPSKCPDCWKF